MTYELVIGDRGYSSWSLRGWLLFDAFGIPVKTRLARLYSDELPNMLKEFFPSKTAPTMRTPDGVVVPETIAIAEELASRHPRPGFGPPTPKRGPSPACWPQRCMQASPPCAVIVR